MKLRLELAIMLLIGIALFYTACKKMNSAGVQSQSNATIGADMVSKQLALSLRRDKKTVNYKPCQPGSKPGLRFYC